MIALTDSRGSEGRLGGDRASRTRESKPTISPSRVAAADVLSRVNRRQGHSDDLLHGPLLAGLSQDDRNLTTALVLGVLRWQIALDARILPLLSRPDALPAEAVRLALRLGAFQLLHMDRIPPHAAINESVELVRAFGHPHAAGMVNAILRKLSVAAPVRTPLHESVDGLAARLGHPAWMVERWVKTYGRAAAAAICEFNQHEPTCGQLFADGASPNRPAMDDGSRLVAEIAAFAAPHAQRIWDCCAAPGGKTLLLACRHPEAELLATDVSPKRLRALGERLTREAPGNKVKTEVADAAASDADRGEFDLILCDVPCSGTGTLARNPEIRHQLQPSELTRQAERQKALLAAGLRRLAPDGRLLYSTCSLEPEECESVVASVFSETPHCERISIEPILGDMQAQGMFAEGTDLSKSVRNRMLRTLPGYSLQADGFFAALLTRR